VSNKRREEERMVPGFERDEGGVYWSFQIGLR